MNTIKPKSPNWVLKDSMYHEDVRDEFKLKSHVDSSLNIHDRHEFRTFVERVASHPSGQSTRHVEAVEIEAMLEQQFMLDSREKGFLTNLIDLMTVPQSSNQQLELAPIEVVGLRSEEQDKDFSNTRFKVGDYFDRGDRKLRSILTKARMWQDHQQGLPQQDYESWQIPSWEVSYQELKDFEEVSGNFLPNNETKVLSDWLETLHYSIPTSQTSILEVADLVNKTETLFEKFGVAVTVETEQRVVVDVSQSGETSTSLIHGVRKLHIDATQASQNGYKVVLKSEQGEHSVVRKDVSFFRDSTFAKSFLTDYKDSTAESNLERIRNIEANRTFSLELYKDGVKVEEEVVRLPQESIQTFEQGFQVQMQDMEMLSVFVEDEEPDGISICYRRHDHGARATNVNYVQRHVDKVLPIQMRGSYEIDVEGQIAKVSVNKQGDVKVDWQEKTHTLKSIGIVQTRGLPKKVATFQSETSKHLQLVGDGELRLPFDDGRVVTVQLDGQNRVF